MNRKSAWTKYDPASLEAIHRFASEYRSFLDRGKTERECVDIATEMARAAGFTDLEASLREGRRLKPGDRVYRRWMNKSVVLFIVGEEPLCDGM